MATRTSTIASSHKAKPEPTPGRASEGRFSERELEEFRQMLLDKRDQLMGDTASLNSGASQHGSPAGGDRSSAMPVHMADLGSDTFDHELTFLLIENKHSLLREIDDALDRIENGTYGVCEATNKPITKPRLRAIPWAKHCIEYALRYEAGLV